MKPIKIIIIGIFVLSAVLIGLLFQQKSNRIKDQLSKKLLGWNPVAIKKIVIKREGHDSILLTKGDGIWKTNRKFDGMGVASQVLLYLSTIQIENSPNKKVDDVIFLNPISMTTFDKNANRINKLLIGKDVAPGVCAAKLNDENSIKLLHSNLNNKSLRILLDSLL